jgi:hypothetical protein
MGSTKLVHLKESMMKWLAMIGGVALLVGAVLYAAGAMPQSDLISTAKLVQTFPSEEQMNQQHIVFDNVSKFAVSDRFIFVCDQRAHTIYSFDFDGHFIRQFGRLGQGPGEFSDPLFIFWYKSSVYVTDRGNTRIQVFSEEGIWKEAWNLQRPVLSPAVTADTIMAESPDPRYLADHSVPLFTFFNLRGEVIRSIPGYLEKSYLDVIKMFEGNYVTLRTGGGAFHALQVYGDIYRIFDTKGNKVKELKLERNPLKDQGYRKLGYLYAYPTFDIDGDNILAYRIAKGSIDIDAFNSDGRYIQTYRCPMDSTLSYLADDMKVVRRGKNVYVYLLLIHPDSIVAVIELRPSNR